VQLGQEALEGVFAVGGYLDQHAAAVGGVGVAAQEAAPFQGVHDAGQGRAGHEGPGGGDGGGEWAALAAQDLQHDQRGRGRQAALPDEGLDERVERFSGPDHVQHDLGRVCALARPNGLIPVAAEQEAKTFPARTSPSR
jgi:hypothetical protein